MGAFLWITVSLEMSFALRRLMKGFTPTNTRKSDQSGLIKGYYLQIHIKIELLTIK